MSSEVVSIVDIQERLEAAGLPLERAAINAKRIFDALQRFPIPEFQILPPVPLPTGHYIVEYQFGSSGYSINNARPSDSPNFMASHHGGSQCDCENLLFLSRAFEIAEEAVPELWASPDKDLVGKLTSSRQHLDTLNEFWWLSRWLPGFSVAANQNINPACSKDVDWRLTWPVGLGSKININLEVKRRIGDVLRMAQGDAVAPEQIFSAGLQDKEGNSKFRPSGLEEINVLGITLIGEVDREVQLAAEKWLGTRDDIDAILLFTRLSVQKAGFDFQIARKADILRQFLDPMLPCIDHMLHGRVQTPLPFTISQLRFLA